MSWADTCGTLCSSWGHLYRQWVDQILCCRSSGSGVLCGRSTRLIALRSSSLWQGHLKCLCRALRTWKAWTASRSSRFIVTIDPRIGCPVPIHGEFITYIVLLGTWTYELWKSQSVKDNHSSLFMLRKRDSLTIKAVSLYCCPDCSSCPANAIQTGLATWAFWAAIKKYKPKKREIKVQFKNVMSMQIVIFVSIPPCLYFFGTLRFWLCALEKKIV